MTVRSTRHGTTLVLALERAPVNALDLDAIEALERAFRELGAAPPTGGVVMTGAGNAFSAGIDTKAFMGYDADARRATVLAITRMVRRMYGLPCPLVTAVNGYALGGGFVLMLTGDARLAADDDPMLGLTEAKAGVPFPAGPLEIIRAELPPQLLRKLALSSAAVSPAELHSMGVLDELYPREGLVDRAVARAASLASQPAFAAVKRQLRAPVVARLDALVESGEDPGLSAFL